MALVLDTNLVAAEDRRDALTSAMTATSGSTRVELEEAPGGVSGQLDLWSFGDASMFRARTTGVSLVRDARTVGATSTGVVAIAVQGGGLGRHQVGEHQRVVQPGDLMTVDVTRPFDFSWRGHGSSSALHVPISELGLSETALRRAAGRLASSPLYRIVSRHITDMTREAEALSASSAAAVGEAGIQLARALLHGASNDGAQSGETLERTLLAQVRIYVNQHLADPDLCADSVAVALAVSRRQLFRVCAQAGFSLEQYTIQRRLQRAHADLATQSSRHLTIAAVAFRWGFKDPTHFTRRFSSAYGLLPSDWRRQSMHSRD